MPGIMATAVRGEEVACMEIEGGNAVFETALMAATLAPCASFEGRTVISSSFVNRHLVIDNFKAKLLTFYRWIAAKYICTCHEKKCVCYFRDLCSCEERCTCGKRLTELLYPNFTQEQKEAHLKFAKKFGVYECCCNQVVCVCDTNYMCECKKLPCTCGKRIVKNSTPHHIVISGWHCLCYSIVCSCTKEEMCFSNKFMRADIWEFDDMPDSAFVPAHLLGDFPCRRGEPPNYYRTNGLTGYKTLWRAIGTPRQATLATLELIRPVHSPVSMMFNQVPALSSILGFDEWARKNMELRLNLFSDHEREIAAKLKNGWKPVVSKKIVHKESNISIFRDLGAHPTPVMCASYDYEMEEWSRQNNVTGPTKYLVLHFPLKDDVVLAVSYYEVLAFINGVPFRRIVKGGDASLIEILHYLNEKGKKEDLSYVVSPDISTYDYNFNEHLKQCLDFMNQMGFLSMFETVGRQNRLKLMDALISAQRTQQLARATSYIQDSKLIFVATPVGFAKFMAWRSLIYTTINVPRIRQVFNYQGTLMTQGIRRFFTTPLPESLKKTMKKGNYTKSKRLKKDIAQGQGLMSHLGDFFKLTVSSLKGFFGILQGAGATILSTFKGLAQGLKDVFSKLYKAFTKFLDFVAEPISAEYRKYLFRFCVSLACIMMTYAVFKTLESVIDVCTKISSVLWGTHGEVLETPVVAEGQGAKHVSILLAFLVAMVTGGSYSARNFSMMSSTINSSRNWIGDFVDMAMYGLDHIWFKITGDHTFLYHTVMMRFINLRKEMAQWEETYPAWQQTMISNPQIIKEVEKFAKAARKLNEDCMMNASVSPMVANQIAALDRMWAERMNLAKRRNPEFGKRKKPVCVWLFGEPGIGKTTIAQAISRSIYEYIQANYPEMEYFEPFSDFQVWSKAKGTDYWDTYAGQFVYMLNEVFTMTDTGKRGEEGSLFLSLIDDVPLPLNMANLVDKGVTYFSSPMVIVTTNFEDFANVGMTSNEALLRRLHFPISMEKKKHIDMSKPQTLQTLNEAWEFTRETKRTTKHGNFKFTYVKKEEKMNFQNLVIAIGDEIVKNSKAMRSTDLGKGIDWTKGNLPNSSSSGSSTEFESVDTDDDNDEKPQVKTVNANLVDIVEDGPTFWAVHRNERNNAIYHNLTSSSSSSCETSSLSLGSSSSSDGKGKDSSSSDDGAGVGKLRAEGQVLGWLSSAGIAFFSYYMAGKSANFVADYMTKDHLHDMMERDLADNIGDPKEYWKLVQTCIEFEMQMSVRSLKLKTPKRILTNHTLDEIFDKIPYINISFVWWLAKHHEEWVDVAPKYKGNPTRLLEIFGSTFKQLTKEQRAFFRNIGALGVKYQHKIKPNEGIFNLEDVPWVQKKIWEDQFKEDPRLGWMRIGVSIMASLATFIVMRKLLSGFTEALLEWWEQEEEEAEGQSEYKKNMPKMRRLKTKENKKAKAKGQIELVNKDNTIDMILKNSYKVRLHGRHKTTGITNCLASGFYLFTTCHADLSVGEIQSVDIFSEEGKMIFCQSRVVETMQLKGRDGLRIKLGGKDCRQFPSLKNRLRSYVDAYPKCTAARIWKDERDGRVIFRNIEGGYIRHCISDLTIAFDYVDGGSGELDVHNYIRVPDCRGISGDCGKPYILVTHETEDLLGFHCASIGKDAIVCPLFKEDLPVEGQCWRQPVLENVIYQEGETIVPGMECEGLIAASKVPHIPTKEEFEESPIFAAMEEDGVVTMAPAVITFAKSPEGVVLDPRKIAERKFGNPDKRKWVQDWSLIDEADNKPSRAYKGFGRPRRPLDELSLEQTLFGIPGVIESYPRDTSATYEFQLLHKKRKELWDPDTGFIDEGLRERVKEIYDAASEGKEIVSYATGCMKSELRPLERVYTASTRLFCVVSLSICIFLKMICGDLMAELKEHLGDVGSSVGINPFSYEWMELFSYLGEVDGPMGGGDAGGWDMNCKCVFTYWFEHYLCECYNVARNLKDPRYLRIRAAARLGIGVVLILGRRAYRVQGMVSSGNFLTSFINSFSNYCVHRLIWRQVRPDNTWKFSEHLRIRVYGDDNIWRVSKEASAFWDMFAISECFTKYFGMNYTTPGKDEVTKPFLSIDEFVFLSRRFRFVRHRGHIVMVLAPLEKESIYGMLAWVRKSELATVTEQLQVNVKTACMEMSQYGRVEYEKFVVKLRAWAHKSNFQCKIDDYETWEDKILSSYHLTSTTMSENWDSVEGMEQCMASIAISSTQ